MSETTAAAKARILNEVRDTFGVSIHSNTIHRPKHKQQTKM